MAKSSLTGNHASFSLISDREGGRNLIQSSVATLRTGFGSRNEKEHVGRGVTGTRSRGLDGSSFSSPVKRSSRPHGRGPSPPLPASCGPLAPVAVHANRSGCAPKIKIAASLLSHRHLPPPIRRLSFSSVTLYLPFRPLPSAPTSGMAFSEATAAASNSEAQFSRVLSQRCCALGLIKRSTKLALNSPELTEQNGPPRRPQSRGRRRAEV